MYPLDRGAWGPVVRIRNLRDELSHVAALDVIAGTRGERRRAALRYATSGRLRALDGIYVESASFLPAETDVALLAVARGLGVPVITYVRDAYQLFPDLYPRSTWKARLSAAAFRPSIAALGAVSSRLAFPSAGLAAVVLGAERGRDAVLLPPGAPAMVNVPRDAGARQLLFVGDARLAPHGADRLIAAAEVVRRGGTEIEVTMVVRSGQEPPGPHPEWLHLERAEGEGIHRLLPRVVATVIPRPRNAYNDLALPIKLFDYLAYGRPLLVTDCVEQARVVREAAAGIVVGDQVEALADGIRRIASAPDAELDGWSTNAHRAAGEASWTARARAIAALFDA